MTSERSPGERLIVCRNPILGDRRRREREDRLTRAEDHIRRCASMYARGQLGRDACNRRLGKVNEWKMQKHFRFTFDPDSRTLHWTRDEDSIAAEAATDGLYVIRTSRSAADMVAPDVVRAYQDLQHVEQAFQTMKTMLLLRPIDHDDEKRVRGHRFLCMLADYVTWHLRRVLRPMRFDDPVPDPEPAPVKPRTRSGRARRRDACRRAADGTVLFPLSELLRRLNNLVAFRLRLPTVPGPGDVLRLSGADRLTPRVFELLDCSPHLPPPRPPRPAGEDSRVGAGWRNAIAGRGLRDVWVSKRLGSWV